MLVDETTDFIIEDLLKVGNMNGPWNVKHRILKKQVNPGKQNVEDLLISCETLPMLTDRKVIGLIILNWLKSPETILKKIINPCCMKLLKKKFKKPSRKHLVCIHKYGNA
ncbi:MAG: hypothetical protein Ct9H300mP28_36620 [Pseudomonadota bacterium]|nr:MAG: hypothetical protein Ct9H300mP28_36620 [Pseudomonadota bacterium]